MSGGLGSDGRWGRLKINSLFLSRTHDRIEFHSIPFHSIPIHSIPFHSIPIHSIPFHVLPNAVFFTNIRPRYQVSVYRTIGPLVKILIICPTFRTFHQNMYIRVNRDTGSYFNEPQHEKICCCFFIYEKNIGADKLRCYLAYTGCKKPMPLLKGNFSYITTLKY